MLFGFCFSVIPCCRPPSFFNSQPHSFELPLFLSLPNIYLTQSPQVSHVPRTSSIHAISSTPYGEPSNVDNPGPGTYNYSSSIAVKKVGNAGGFGAGLGISGSKGDSSHATAMTHLQGRNQQPSESISSRKGRLLVAPEWNAPSVPTTLSKGPFAHPEG